MGMVGNPLFTGRGERIRKSEIQKHRESLENKGFQPRLHIRGRGVIYSKSTKKFSAGK